MGKRIRWIWVISLAAALAAIGVQGYWLFNQFRYEMCTYADEIAGEVFHAGQEEFRIRKEEAEMTKGTYIIERQSKYQSGDSVLNGLKNSFGFQLYPKDTTKIHSFRLHLDPNMPEDSLGNYILLYTITKIIKGHITMYPFIIQSFFSFFFPFPSFLTLQERVFRKRGSRGSIFGL